MEKERENSDLLFRKVSLIARPLSVFEVCLLTHRPTALTLTHGVWNKEEGELFIQVQKKSRDNPF